MASAHCQARTTKEYLRADRLALRRSPRSRSERIQPEAGASIVALRVTDRLPANEEGVSSGVGTALSCIRTKSVVQPLLFPAELYGEVPRSLTSEDGPEVRRWCAGSGVPVSKSVAWGAARREALSPQVPFGGSSRTGAVAQSPEGR